MPARKSAKKSTKKSVGLSAEEKAAARETIRERQQEPRTSAEGERLVRAKIAEMQDQDRALAERVHSIVKATAPDLFPKTFYGMPAYAKDGKVLIFFKPGQKFKMRYAELGFTVQAKLDEGRMWPT
ncbi:MAG: hypothetical protein LC620_02855, partial [Halobacteriales archaeon]|nr:hypothetical protein [Halobacteriales archaeon]